MTETADGRNRANDSLSGPAGSSSGTEMSRRQLLRAAGLGAGMIGAPALLGACGGGGGGRAPKSAPSGEIEKNAKLKLLRWSEFIDTDKKVWLKNTKAFTDKTGVPVSIDWEAWPDIAPKAASAAHAGSGPDIIIGFFDQPQQFPTKVIDITDLAEGLGKANGGWFDTCRKYGNYQGKWIGLPLGAPGTQWNYRKSWMEKAGFSTFPTDTDTLLEAAKALKSNGHPIGMALGHAVGDANTWTHWLIWAFGGMTVDENNKVAVESPEVIKALEYVRKLYQNFISGTPSWLDSNNNKAYLAGDIAATTNGISIYFSAKEQNPRLGEDTMTAPMPVGPVGKPTEFHLMSQAMIFAYTKYPNAAREYLKFMWSKEQYLPWMRASSGYTSPPFADYAKDDFWNSDPRYKAFQHCARDMLWDGYKGDLSTQSAQALADYIVVDMVSRAATGQQSPKESASQAAQRLKQIYRR